MKTLVLDTTSKSITAVMSSAPATTQPDFITTWADNTGTTFTEGSTDGILNGVTAVTLVGSPAASARRIIKSIAIQNRDTAPVTITLNYINGAASRNIVKVTLAVNDTWTSEGTFDSAGNFKQTGIGATPLTIGTEINDSTAQTQAIDTDRFAFSTSSVLKHITWTNIKATLKTYFDTLYLLADGAVTKAKLATALKGYTDLGNVGGTVNINCALGIHFKLVMTSAITSLTFSNFSTEQFKTITLEITGNFTIAQPTTVKGDWTAFDGTLTNQIQIYLFDVTTPVFSSGLINW